MRWVHMKPILQMVQRAMSLNRNLEPARAISSGATPLA